MKNIHKKGNYRMHLYSDKGIKIGSKINSSHFINVIKYNESPYLFLQVLGE